MNRDIDWDEIVEQLGPRLFGYFRRRGAESEATDLTQETLIRLFDKVEDGAFDALKGSLAQLGFGIARLVWLEHRRSRNALISLGDTNKTLADTGPSSEELILTQQKQSRFRKALAKLPSAQREVVELIVDGWLQFGDVAVILNMPEGTVKSHFHRAKENLRAELNEYEESL